MPSAAAAIRYRFGRFELLPDERQLLADGDVVRLGPHAFDLLVVLVERSGRLVTKGELLSLVWPRAVVEENTLQVHVSALRKVLGADAIATVAGRGYRFVLAVEREAEPDAGPRHNLPNQLTSFVGREAEIGQVAQLLASTRLLTLTGAGGCGKTRLALRVASDFVDRFENGVRFVELAPLVEARLVPQAVASALEIDEQPGKAIVDTLAAWLGTRHLLLVLDNAEHLLGACARLAEDLLRRCAGLTLLVTSRERLGIAGETTFRVPSLKVSDEAQQASAASVLACEAARLFIERAQLQRPDFSVPSADVPALASVCRRLDGIALAIELAAPRVRHMSLRELSGRLDHRFGLLTGGSRTALPRHRTLRSLIDWSYDLLVLSEKTLLQRLSVFAGGWTLDAAEQVCSGQDVDAGAVLELLTSLADKSLVTVDTRDDATRFGMLETVREYALDCLRDSGGEAPVRARHVDCFLGIARQLDIAEHDDERRAALGRLDDERDNLRAALRWCEANPDCSMAGLRMAGMLNQLWELRGAYTEGRGWIARLLAVAPDAERGEDHMRAFHTAGALAYIQADFEPAASFHGEALAIAQRLGHRRQVFRALGSLGNIAYSLENHDEARARYAEALAMAREIGDPRFTTNALYALGLTNFECGDLEASRALLEESLAHGKQFGLWSASRPRMILGVIHHVQGDLQAAHALLTEAAAGSNELGDRGLYSRTICYLGLLLHDQGDEEKATVHVSQALAIQHELDGSVMLGYSVQAAACLVARSAGPIAVARLLGAARRMRQLHGRRDNDFDMRERHRLLVAAARERLRDDAAFDQAWSDGASMTQEAVVRDALALLEARSP